MADRRASPAQREARAAAFFDGAQARAAASGVTAKVSPAGSTQGRFQSRDGAAIGYSLRSPAHARGPARVFVGGMTLPESFLTYLDSARSERADYTLSLRGLPGTAWSATGNLYDADAYDMARMIVTAARSSGGRVELALHSYGTLVFQRMLQLRGDPEVARALEALRGGRVTMFAPATHYGDSETVAGPEYADMARAIRTFMSWLDAGDAYMEQWRSLARLNPALLPQALAYEAWWVPQRTAGLALWSKPASDLLLQHLGEPWSPELEPARRALLAESRAHARDAGWQEAALRRANDTSRLDFKAEDAAALRAAGVHLDLVLSSRDQLIPWASARLLPAFFGIDLPGSVPPAGSVYSDETGLVRVLVADGDHYLPLKDPAAAGSILR
ncbi:MAG: hypothetical protein HYV15_06635 [Elusimicrobia bacterium]|nr:hypothetical protein [Elusimicrobiota bacterium]